MAFSFPGPGIGDLAGVLENGAVALPGLPYLFRVPAA
jgi:hypothetical protein